MSTWNGLNEKLLVEFNENPDVKQMKLMALDVEAQNALEKFKKTDEFQNMEHIFFEELNLNMTKSIDETLEYVVNPSNEMFEKYIIPRRSCLICWSKMAPNPNKDKTFTSSLDLFVKSAMLIDEATKKLIAIFLRKHIGPLQTKLEKTEAFENLAMILKTYGINLKESLHYFIPFLQDPRTTNVPKFHCLICLSQQLQTF